MKINEVKDKKNRMPTLRAVIEDEQKRKEKYAKLSRMREWNWNNAHRGYLNGLIDAYKISYSVRKELFWINYNKILEHRSTCKKWGKKFCLGCFGGGLTKFSRKLAEEEALL